MSKQLSDTQRQYLTEQILGECWHEEDESAWYGESCKKCKHSTMDIETRTWTSIVNTRRTFESWEDFGALVSKMNSYELYSLLYPYNSNDFLKHWCEGLTMPPLMVLALTLQQPDFPLRFAKAECEWKGIK